MSQFTYTIKEFNKELKSFIVGFEDNSWARIDLKTPLPANQSELEEIIKRFTAPQEVIDAREDKESDLSFIELLVGESNTIDRFVLTQKPTNPVQQSPEEIDRIRNYQKLLQEKSWGDFLVSCGLLEINPITQEMLDETNPSFPKKSTKG